MPSSGTSSAWAPFRHRLFAAMWSAQLVTNIGGWMQTVAAQWLMLSLTTSAVYVTLVQTAAGLPVVLFAVLAGTIGDLVDRRRFLLRAPAPARTRDHARSGPAGPGPRTGRPGAPARGHALADA